MIKTKAFSTFIVCSILISGISNSYIFGMDEEKWNGELYDQHSQPQFEHGCRNLEDFNLDDATLTFGARFVELGCATANLAAHIAEKAPLANVVGIDPEENAIAFAQKKHEDIPNLRLRYGDARDFALTDKANLIVFYAALQWIPSTDHQAVFHTIARNMADKGILDMRTSAKRKSDNPDLILLAFLQTSLTAKWWPNFSQLLQKKLTLLDDENPLKETGSPLAFSSDAPEPTRENLSLIGQLVQHNSFASSTPETVKSLAENAKLEVVFLKENDEEYEYQNKEEFIPWLTNVIRAYGITESFGEKESEWISDGVDTYCDRYNKPTDGSIVYPRRVVRLIAHKEAT